MTAVEHNKYLGWVHIIYATGFTLLLGLSMILFLYLSLRGAGSTQNDSGDVPIEIFVGFFLIGYCISFALLVPSFIAGYGLLKRKRWARTWGIVAAITSTLIFPLGIAVAVYSFWFLFGKQGTNLYKRRLESSESTPDVYLPPSNPYGWQ